MGAFCYNRKGDKELIVTWEEKNVVASINTNNTEDKKLQKPPTEIPEMQENNKIVFTQDESDSNADSQKKNQHEEHQKQSKHQNTTSQEQNHKEENATPQKTNQNEEEEKQSKNLQFQNSIDSQKSPTQKSPSQHNQNEKTSVTRSSTKRRTVIDKLYVCYALFHLTDVTPVVSSQVRSYDLNIEVTPEQFGLKKSKKNKRYLNVWIWENLGLTHYQTLEGETLNIHRDEYNIVPLKDIQSGCHILSAVFGDQDVTEKVKKMTNSKTTKIKAKPELFGLEKIQQKRIFVVLAQIKGHKNIIFRQCEEGAEISLEQD